MNARTMIFSKRTCTSFICCNTCYKIQIEMSHIVWILAVLSKLSNYPNSFVQCTELLKLLKLHIKIVGAFY